MDFEPIRETQIEWARVCQPLSVVIDATLPTERAAIAALLEVMRTSAYTREARTVIRLIRLAADPLSIVGTMARDALRSWVQVSRFSETPGWTRPEEIVSAPRATALFHLGVAVVEGRYRPAGVAAKKFEAVIRRLEVAAEAENAARSRDIEELGRMRSAALPGFNEWLDRWLEL